MLINILSPFETWLSETEPHYYSNIKENTRKGSSTASEGDIEIVYNTNNETCNTNIREAKESAINSYSTYHQNKLILSNDIETHPGPENTTLLKILILLILAIALKKAKADVKSLSHHSQTVFNFNTMHFLCKIRFVKKRINQTHIEIKTNSSYLTLRILLAGDVHTNPGPELNQMCINCKVSVNKEQAVNCNTCKGWCHLDCSALVGNTATLEHSFEWLCPNPTCMPNHHTGITSSISAEENINRFSTFETSKNSKKKRTPNTKKVRKPREAKKITKKEKCPNKDLLNILPKTSTEEYIGKEICKACNKFIHKRQKAISCDGCERWTHLKCSDMLASTYKENDNKDFPWVCNTCRKAETEIKEIIDLDRLKPEQLPVSNSDFNKTANEFLILHYNCRSMMNKALEIYNICKDLQPSILCLTETWLDESAKITNYIPKGYKAIRKDRSEKFKQKYGKSNGGGILIIYREELRVNKIDIDISTEETLWVEVKAKKRSFILGTVYRASYTHLLTEDDNGSEFETQLNKITSKSKKLMVIGDLNCDMASEKPDKPTNSLKEVFETHSMVQLISKPTRIDLETNKSTTIDHVWTNPEDNMIKESGTIEGISDHVGVYVKTNNIKPKPAKNTIIYRCYKNYSPEKFNEELNEALKNPDLTELIDAKRGDEATTLWIKIFSETANRHAPLIEKTVTTKMKKIPWYNENLEALMKEKTKKLQLYRLYGLFTDLKLVKTLSNKITHLKRKLKKMYYSDKINSYEGDPRKIWKVMKDVTNTEDIKDKIEPSLMNQDKANTFNNFFATVGTKIQEKLNIKTPVTDFNPETGNFSFQEESEENIIKLIDRLKTNIAVGVDDINVRLVKDTKHTIAKSLKQLVNISYKTSTFPNSMKRAIVKAIHKKGETDDPANYRPLSILPIISKIFERSAVNQLVQYLEGKKLLTHIQHAYRRGHSTQTCLNEIVNYIYEENDKGNIVGIASLDLSKAFDSINHDLLLLKLNKLGLCVNSLKWCRSYLTNRKQQTKFTKYTSSTETVTSGVPQGSILGPILFICFVNDLPEIFKNCKIMSYADDTQILVTAKTAKQIKKKIETLIKQAQLWYTENSLLNNASKTEVIAISNRKIDETFVVNITENGKPVELTPKSSIKVLGVHIDNRLNWNKQVNEVNKKARYATRNLQRTFNILPFKCKLALYNSLVASHFNYADTVWGGLSVKNKNKLQRTQNTVIKSMLGMKFKDSSEEALKKANLLSLDDKRKVHDAVYVHKALAGTLPDQVNQQYLKHRSSTSLRSAEKQTLNIPKHTHEKYKNSPLYRTIAAWNASPTDIRKKETTTFKKQLQANLQRKKTR